MLKFIECEKFIENGLPRGRIEFFPGLNSCLREVTMLKIQSEKALCCLQLIFALAEIAIVRKKDFWKRLEIIK